MKRIPALLFVILAVAGLLHGQTTMTLTCAEGSASMALIPLILAVYAELGIEAEVIVMPAERALREVNEGNADGDVGRAGGGLEIYPNLIVNNEPLGSIDLVPWVKKDSAIAVRSVQSLKDYKVAYARGLKLAEGFCTKAGITAEVTSSIETLAKMLEGERFDIALSAFPTSTPALSAVAVPLPLKLATAKSFHVLNKKHSALIPKIDAVLVAMKADSRHAALTAPK